MPDKNMDSITYMVHKITLLSSDNLLSLVLLSKTWCSAVLDSGTSSTVCGRLWFGEYVKSLLKEDKSKVLFEESSKPFWFRDGKQFVLSTAAIIQANIGQHQVSIRTNIIDLDIPLLLSKATTKNGQIGWNFQNSTITYLGDEIPLNTTSNGFYVIPITAAKQLSEKIDSQCPHHHIVLKTTEEKSNREKVTKLHQSFAHFSIDKLLALIGNSGKQWSENNDLKREVRNVTENCSVHKIYKKHPLGPVVSLSLADQFQQMIAMDLKEYHGRIKSNGRLHKTLSTNNNSKQKQRHSHKGNIRTWIAV